MIETLNIILLFFIPLTIARRVIKHHSAAVLNPMVYLLVFAYLYLIVPTAYLDDVLPVYGFNFSESAKETVDLLSIWYVLVFYLFYYFSPDLKPIPTNEGVIASTPQPTSVVVAISSAIIVTIVISVVIYSHGRNLLAIRSDRIAAFLYYQTNIFDTYKILTLITVMMGAVQVLIWRYKTIFPILLLAPFVLLDFLHGGRIMSLMVLLFSYINFIIFKSKGAIYVPIVIGALLILSGILQRSATEHFDEIGISLALGEFTTSKIATYHTAQFFTGAGNPYEYFTRSVFGIFPPVLVDFFLPKSSVPFYLYISNSIGRESGFTNTLVGEALFYGGLSFSVVSPILIALFYRVILYQYSKIMSFPKFLLFLLIILRTQNAFRLGIYSNSFQSFYVMYSYYIFYTFLEWNKPFLKFSKVDA